MKTILSIFTLAAVMTACTSKQGNTPSTSQSTTTDTTRMVTAPSTDTAGLAAYQRWKAQHELSSPDQYNKTTQEATAHRTITRTHRMHHTYSSPVYSNTSTSSNAAMAPENTVKEKRGWSSGAKGAVIGGVSGAAM